MIWQLYVQLGCVGGLATFMVLVEIQRRKMLRIQIRINQSMDEIQRVKESAVSEISTQISAHMEGHAELLDHAIRDLEFLHEQVYRDIATHPADCEICCYTAPRLTVAASRMRSVRVDLKGGFE